MQTNRMDRQILGWVAASNLLLATAGFGQQPGSAGQSRDRTVRPPVAGPENPQPVETNRGYTGISVEAQRELRSLLIEGAGKQVEQLLKLVEELDKISGGAEPDIRVVRLKNADSEALAKLLTSIYAARDTTRPGAVSTPGGAANAAHGKVAFVAIAQPNSVAVVAQKTDIADVADFVAELDAESKTGVPMFRIFKLKEAPAAEVQGRLKEYFTLGQQGDAAAAGNAANVQGRAGLRPRVEIIADVRTNSLIVFAGPEDMNTTEKMIEQLDGGLPTSVNIVRVFPLKNSVASELATLLQSAILARTQVINAQAAAPAGANAGNQQGNQANLFGQGQQGGNQGGNQRGGQGQNSQSSSPVTTGGLKGSRLRVYGPDKRTGKIVEAGILEDITIAADDRSNSLLVTAPPSNMDLLAEIIAQFDGLPSPSAQLKVYKLLNADAQAMLTTLQQVFLGQQTSTTGGQFGGQNLANNQNRQQVSFNVGGVDAAVSLVPLTFSLDVRTNSIIVSGAANDILAVEALLIKLDSNTERERKTIVYRLKNLGATDASTAIDSFLAQQAGTGTTGGATGAAAAQNLALTLQQQIRNEVSVVPEPTSNVLIVSSTPRFFEEVVRIIDEIDTRPPQVLIKVLIADVILSDDEELGLEMGVQSDVLFDRSLTVTNSSGSAQLVPGYNFNSTQPLGSGVIPGNGPDKVGQQALTNFGLGRASTRNGFGGLLFSASSENISVLLRALKRQQRVDILSRPSVMALDNQQAYIQIGQSVPVIQNSQVAQNGTTINGIQYRDVGIILQVTPRINPDGTVIMNVQPQVSSINPVGQPISTNLDGTVVATAPIIDIVQAQTTVTAMNGQTIVIGGLIRKERNTDKRKIPWLGDIPVLGWLGKTEFKFGTKRELLIVLTPEIVYGECDVQRIKDAEARRIGWNLSDVDKVHGDIGLTDAGKTYIGPSAMFKAKPQKSAPDPKQRPLNHSEKKRQKLDADGNPMAEEDIGTVTADGQSANPPTIQAPLAPMSPNAPGPAPRPLPKVNTSGIFMAPNAPTASTSDMDGGRVRTVTATPKDLSSDIVVLSSGDRPVVRSNKPPEPIYVQAPFEKEITEPAKKPKTGGLARLFGSTSKEGNE